MANKSKSVAQWLSRELLTSPYCYGLCVTEKSFESELKRLKVPQRDWPKYLTSNHASATTHFLEEKNSHGLCCIVTIEENCKRRIEQIYALLVHEAVHIWQAIKDSIGENHPASEQEAYAIQRISLELMCAYADLTKSKSKKQLLKN